jgi:hypothetical protein
LGCQISCESKLTRVIREIGPLELHFNSRDACIGKIGGLEPRDGLEALGGDQGVGRKSVTQFKVNGT